MMDLLKFVEAHQSFFWLLPAACFVAALTLVVIHRRRRTMPLFEIGTENVMRPAKAPNEAWRRK